jgi:hypothetical protein
MPLQQLNDTLENALDNDVVIVVGSDRWAPTPQQMAVLREALVSVSDEFAGLTCAVVVRDLVELSVKKNPDAS